MVFFSLVTAPAAPLLPGNDGAFLLHASNAVTHGSMLRYEPQTNKNCLGYWTKVEDWAEWSFHVAMPGVFAIELWQGCGQGQGGSDVNVEVGGKTFHFVVEDTGHFQNFRPRQLGEVYFEKPGDYSLAIKPQRKQAAAVMDIRQVRLVRVSSRKGKTLLDDRTTGPPTTGQRTQANGPLKNPRPRSSRRKEALISPTRPKGDAEGTASGEAERTAPLGAPYL